MFGVAVVCWRLNVGGRVLLRGVHRELQGHTLVELLIAMALSLVLMSAVVQAYLAGVASFSVQRQQALLQQNGRFALQFIEKQVRRAGYVNQIDLSKYVSSNQSAQNDFLTLSDFDVTEASFVAGAVVTGLDGSMVRGVKEQTDVLHIRYQKNESGLFKDCMNTNLDADAELEVIISFYVDTDDVLRCRGARNAGGRRVSAALVEGIEDMQLLYGVDNNHDNATDKYITASDISEDEHGDSEWLNVTSLRLALLVNSGLVNGGARTEETGAQEQSYQLLDETLSFHDGKIRAVFTQGIRLRNQSFSL